jgi:hypothetical protein
MIRCNGAEVRANTRIETSLIGDGCDHVIEGKTGYGSPIETAIFPLIPDIFRSRGKGVDNVDP